MQNYLEKSRERAGKTLSRLFDVRRSCSLGRLADFCAATVTG